MGMPELNAYVIEVVRTQPDPPRHYDRQMLWHLLRDPVIMILSMWGAFLMIGMPFAILVTQAWHTPVRLLWYVVIFALAVWMFIAPFHFMWQWHVGIRSGRIAWAEATKVEIQGEYMTAGIWVVQLPDRTITNDLSIRTFWASRLREGDRFRVLLHPTRPKILLPLGPLPLGSWAVQQVPSKVSGTAAHSSRWRQIVYRADATCPNCGNTTFRKDPGIANGIGTTVVWYKQGTWWSRLAAHMLFALMLCIFFMTFLQVIIPDDPQTVRFLGLLWLLTFLGGSLWHWFNDIRKGKRAIKYTCQSCRLQWIVRVDDAWPTLEEARQQHQFLNR